MALSTLLIRTASKAKSVAGHDDLIDTRSPKGDEFSADQRLGHAAHTSTFTSSKQDRTDVQPRSPLAERGP